MIQAQLIEESIKSWPGLIMKRWYLSKRFNIGSWHGENPKGVIKFATKMGELDLHTGEYKLYGPVGVLPN